MFASRSALGCASPDRSQHSARARLRGCGVAQAGLESLEEGRGEIRDRALVWAQFWTEGASRFALADFTSPPGARDSSPTSVRTSTAWVPWASFPSQPSLGEIARSLAPTWTAAPERERLRAALRLDARWAELGYSNRSCTHRSCPSRAGTVAEHAGQTRVRFLHRAGSTTWSAGGVVRPPLRRETAAMFRLACGLAALLSFIACDKSLEEENDAGHADAEPRDAGSRDASPSPDLGSGDAASAPDAEPVDAAPDGGVVLDVGVSDGGPIGRSQHQATLLADGRVLVTGGFAGAPLDTAVIFDPSTSQWAATGRMTSARRYHGATLLPDGRVLVTGGRAGQSAGLNTAEVFDPATGVFTATANLIVPREYHNTALLPSGEILLATGFNQTKGSLEGAEIYAADLTSSRVISNLNAEGGARSMVQLLDGRYLLAGGHRGAEVREAEIFDPSDESFTSTGDMVRGVTRAAHVRLTDGRVFFAGGSTVNVVTELGQIYDPSTGTFSTTTGTMAVASQGRTARLLPDGRVLVFGGWASASSYVGVEVFDPVTERFSPGAAGFRPRAEHTATTLTDGRTLIVGGYDQDGNTDSVQLYDPTTDTFSDTTPLPPN